eukprot:GILJ01008766.1.p1 GENE.GILJ01008766.1~~GILJ01008766.1.p1  ORF type:complete len:718 (-),score=87.57 GILJ01008766.1:39-2192(-)
MSRDVDLICPVCFGLLLRPVMLSCPHSVCANCAQKLYDQQVLTTVRGQSRVFLICPSCRVKTPVSMRAGVEVLQQATFLDKPLRMARRRLARRLCGVCDQAAADVFCKRCEVYYCTDCKDSTHASSAFRSHSVVPLTEDGSEGTECMRHRGRIVEYFCLRDNTLVCKLCLQKTDLHKGHQTLAIVDAANRITVDEIRETVQRSRELEDVLSNMKQTSQEASDLVQNSVKDARHQIVSVFESLRQALTRREAEMLRGLDVMATDKCQQIHARNAALESILKESKSVLASHGDEKNLKSAIAKLKCKQDVSRLLETLESIPFCPKPTPLVAVMPNQFSFVHALSRYGDVIEAPPLASSLLVDRDLQNQLFSWLPQYENPVLLFRASIHGFSNRLFHELCDFQGPTLCIAKSCEGILFGAFTAASWVPTPAWKADPYAFLFFVSYRDDNAELVRSEVFQNSVHAVYSRKDYGPTYGGNHDLAISLDDRVWGVDLGNTFRLPKDRRIDFLEDQFSSDLEDLEIFAVSSVDILAAKVGSSLAWRQLGMKGLAFDMRQSLQSFLPLDYNSLVLLYQTSSHGYSNVDFHRRCDYKGPTLLLVKLSTGHIFGGYTAVSWTGAGCYETDPKAFLFSLSDGRGRPAVKLELNQKANKAIFCASHMGPAFGGGYDLYIDFDHVEDSCSNLGHTYVLPKDGLPHTFLAGTHKEWPVEEVLVYQILVDST